jgi:hypothetical protein
MYDHLLGVFKDRLSRLQLRGDSPLAMRFAHAVAGSKRSVQGYTMRVDLALSR